MIPVPGKGKCGQFGGKKFLNGIFPDYGNNSKAGTDLFKFECKSAH